MNRCFVFFNSPSGRTSWEIPNSSPCNKIWIVLFIISNIHIWLFIYTIPALLSFHLTPDLSTFDPVWRCRSGLDSTLLSPVPLCCGASSPPSARSISAWSRSSVPVTGNPRRTHAEHCLDPFRTEEMSIMGKFWPLWETNSARGQQSLLGIVFPFPWQLFAVAHGHVTSPCFFFHKSQ